MKTSLKKISCYTILSIFCFLLLEIIPSYSSDTQAQKIRDKKIELDLKEARENLTYKKKYFVDKSIIRENVYIYIKPYNLISENVPEWWSEKQAYDMSYLLMKALNYYPGINANLEKTWEENILEKEKIFKENSLNSSTNRRITISPILEEFKYQILTPRTRGVGIGYVAFNRKTCMNETFLATKYQFESPVGSTIFIDDVISKQLLVKRKSGSSLNVNLLVAGLGGGKFKAPEKPIKEIVYNSIVDSAEGIYCSVSNNRECIKFYQEREYKYPTVEKKRRKKKKDKSC